LILAKDAGQKNPWFNYLHKGNPILIISMNFVETEQGLKIVIIISVCKPNDGSWVEAKVKTPKVFCYARWDFLISREHGENFSKVHALMFDDWNTIWLVPRETYAENILF
jgi:hypothetical protein